jgi:hypothetical protein
VLASPDAAARTRLVVVDVDEQSRERDGVGRVLEAEEQQAALDLCGGDLVRAVVVQEAEEGAKVVRRQVALRERGELARAELARISIRLLAASGGCGERARDVRRGGGSRAPLRRQQGASGRPWPGSRTPRRRLRPQRQHRRQAL